MIHFFKKSVSHIALPEKFTYPFHYTPHPLCVLAAEEVKKEIPAVVEQEVSKQLSKQKVQIEIDKQSAKKAQKAINDLLAPLAKWFK